MGGNGRSELRRHWWHAAAIACLVALYWPGLNMWFYQDDFGWLNLWRGIDSWTNFWRALFLPHAHGNLRLLGENAYWLLFTATFGAEPLPFRICAFATQAAALVLLGVIVRRLTGSASAGFAAQIFWIANTGLAAAMCWTSIYNQILCGFCLLLAFYFLLRYTETGSRRFYAAQWIAFALGLGALETAVVYPALAIAYTWWRARPFFRSTLPLLAGSAVFTGIHFAVAPPPAGGVYALHWDTSMLKTLWTYWAWALGPPRLPLLASVPSWVPLLLAVVLTAALCGACILAARRGEWTGMAGVVWFVVVLGPYLPLRDHLMDYYLAVPAIGMAAAGAWALWRAWHAGAWRWVALGCAGVYLGISVPAARAIAEWHYRRSQMAENLVLGAAEARRLQPGRTILLTGVRDEQFFAALADVPFRALDISRVYLAPDGNPIQAPRAVTRPFTLPEALARAELEAGRAMIYDASGPVLRNITTSYGKAALARWSTGTPQFINPGDPLFARFLGSGWDVARDGQCAAGPRAALRIGGPRNPAERLHLILFRTSGPPRVTADGVPLTVAAAAAQSGQTEFRADLPAGLTGRPELELVIETPGGCAFGFVEIGI